MKPNTLIPVYLSEDLKETIELATNTIRLKNHPWDIVKKRIRLQTMRKDLPEKTVGGYTIIITEGDGSLFGLLPKVSLKGKNES